MQTTDKIRTGIYLSEATNDALRDLYARHRGSSFSSLVEDMIEYCHQNKTFLAKVQAKYSPKKEEEIDYPI